MNFSDTYRRMNEPVGPSPDLIRKTLSPSGRRRFPRRRLIALAAAAAVLLATPALAVRSELGYYALYRIAPAVAQFFRLLDGVSMPRGAVRTPEGRWDVTRYACCVNTDTGTYYYRTYDSLGVAAVTFGEERRAGRELLEFPLEELSAQPR